MNSAPLCVKSNSKKGSQHKDSKVDGSAYHGNSKISSNSMISRNVERNVLRSHCQTNEMSISRSVAPNNIDKMLGET